MMQIIFFGVIAYFVYRFFFKKKPADTPPNQRGGSQNGSFGGSRRSDGLGQDGRGDFGGSDYGYGAGSGGYGTDYDRAERCGRAGDYGSRGYGAGGGFADGGSREEKTFAACLRCGTYINENELTDGVCNECARGRK